ncbi:hypothetical protein K0U27_01110 [archaeon]|nr:hypothetical protein [archaeon]
MGKTIFPIHLEDKFFEIRYDSGSVSKIISYFPLPDPEKQEICNILHVDAFDGFHTIFTDLVSDDDWDKTKDQIKKRFKDELFDIDKMPKS